MEEAEDRRVRITNTIEDHVPSKSIHMKRKKRLSKVGQARPITDVCRKTVGAPPPNVPTKKTLTWWERPPIKYAFSMLPVRNKLEMLMGSNLVCLTDRDYMVYLQIRMLDDYEKAINKRIALRQVEEMERVKNLVLNGKIPLDEAPIEMANHPVMLIDQYCKKVLAERRAKMKVLRPFIPKYLYWDDTPDPPSGLSIESGHRLRPNNERLCIPPELFLATEVSENLADGYMLEQEQYEALHYESEDVKMLRASETVEEMYNAADEVLGIIGLYEVEEEEVSHAGSVVSEVVVN